MTQYPALNARKLIGNIIREYLSMILTSFIVGNEDLNTFAPRRSARSIRGRVAALAHLIDGFVLECAHRYRNATGGLQRCAGTP